MKNIFSISVFHNSSKTVHLTKITQSLILLITFARTKGKGASNAARKKYLQNRLEQVAHCDSRYNYPPNYTQNKCTVVLLGDKTTTWGCILIVMFNSLYTNIKKLSKKCH